MAPAEDDHVTALLAAGRDGLLRYDGLATPGVYEVHLTGRARLLRDEEVSAVVGRLRAIAELADAGAPVRLVDVVDDRDVFVLEVGGRQVEVPAARVVDWCAGYLAAHRAVGQEHAGEDSLVEAGPGQRLTIADLFERPTRDDQCRMVLLGLMHGRAERTSIDKLTQLIGDLPGKRQPARKTIVDALMFGSYMGSEMAENMIAAFGLRWSVSAGQGVCTAAGWNEPADPMPQMPGLARLRRILVASRAGWVRYVGDPAPNSARWSRAYALTVGERGYSISEQSLDGWLDGVEAFHAG